MIKKRLQDIALNITDGKHGDCEGAENSGFYFISCKDVHDGAIHYDGARQITEKDFLDTHKRTMLEPNDILVTNSGTIGRMALVKDVPTTYKTTFQKSVAIIKPNQEIIRPAYLYYCLLNCVNQFINQSNGSAQKNLLLGTMRNFEIEYEEEFDKQDKIINILQTYDSLIENNRKQIKLLEEAAQRLYKEWFINLRFPGYEEVEIVDGVPNGWQKLPMSGVGDYMNGFAFKPTDWQENGLPIIKIKEMSNGIAEDTPRNNGDRVPQKYLIKAGDILFSWSATLMAIIWEGEDGWLNQHLFKVSPAEGIGREYLLQSLQCTKEEFKNLTTGSTMKHIQRGKLDQVYVNVPDKSIMKKYSDICENYREQIIALSRKKALLREARDRILPKLMSGEIEV